MRPPRIAYCSPLNPAPSGIADYSEELLPFLAQYGEMTLYYAEGLKLSNPHLSAHFELRPQRRLLRDARRRPFDAILYHMGNSPAHAEIWHTAQRLPGVVVLHDLVLHHFMLWYAANIEHDVQRYVRRMRERYGEAGEHNAQLMIRSRFSEAAFGFPCNEDVIAAARGLISHSAYIADHVRAARPDLPVAVVPMGVPLPELRDQRAARAALGLPADGVILASFGHINAYKRLEPALRALAALRAEGRPAHYILVGSVSPNFDLPGLVQRMGLRDAVTITGYVAREAFEAYVAAADICLNLRHPTAGETSASLLRLLGAAKPTLVTATGSFVELPPDTVAPVPLGPEEGDLILAYCRALLDQPGLAAALGANARQLVAEQHTLPLAARGYAEFLARHYRWPALQRFRETPLWDPSPPSSALPAAPPAAPAAAPAAPPMASAASPLTQAVGQALDELGLEQVPEGVLHQIAARIAEL